jgi:PleD family two-component response regulator
MGRSVVDRSTATCRFAYSVGIADCAEDLSHALERADRALYAAKAGGRSRACFAEGELAA